MKNIYLILVSILLITSCGQQPASETENKIKVGSVGFHVAFKVPNDSIQRMEVFLKTLLLIIHDYLNLIILYHGR